MEEEKDEGDKDKSSKKHPPPSNTALIHSINSGKEIIDPNNIKEIIPIGEDPNTEIKEDVLTVTGNVTNDKTGNLETTLGGV